MLQYWTPQIKHSIWEDEERPFLGQLGVEYTPQTVIPLIFKTVNVTWSSFLQKNNLAGITYSAEVKFPLGLLDLGPKSPQSSCGYWSVFPQRWHLKWYTCLFIEQSGFHSLMAFDLTGISQDISDEVAICSGYLFRALSHKQVHLSSALFEGKIFCATKILCFTYL